MYAQGQRFSPKIKETPITFSRNILLRSQADKSLEEPLDIVSPAFVYQLDCGFAIIWALPSLGVPIHGSDLPNRSTEILIFFLTRRILGVIKWYKVGQIDGKYSSRFVRGQIEAYT
jgi:hypothetical protein